MVIVCKLAFNRKQKNEITVPQIVYACATCIHLVLNSKQYLGVNFTPGLTLVINSSCTSMNHMPLSCDHTAVM